MDRNELRKELVPIFEDLELKVEDGHPFIDGQAHRCRAIDDKPGQKSGFYRLYPDEHPAGYLVNNRTKRELRWKSRGQYLSKSDIASLTKEAEAKKLKRKEEEVQRQKQTADRVWKQLKEREHIKKPTPYMISKKIEPHFGAYVDRENKNLTIPLYDIAGTLWLCSYISEDGQKRLAKNGRKTGSFHVLGGYSRLHSVPLLILCEGYSTAATVKQCVGIPTICCLDSGNLLPVAESLRKKYPRKHILVCGDDDTGLVVNSGRKKAIQASKAVDGYCLFPLFAAGEQEADPKNYTDFNDLSVNSVLGDEAVHVQVRAKIKAILG